MKLSLGTLLLVAVVSLSSFAGTDAIIEMARKGTTEEAMLTAVDKSDGYNLTAADILKLKEAKVSDKVVAAMLKHRKTSVKASAADARAEEPAPRPAQDARAEFGTLNIENLDSQVWFYQYEPAKKMIWISATSPDGKGRLDPHGGIALRMPVGMLKVRYSGHERGEAVSVLAGEKSELMLGRVATDGVESLNVSVFESGRKVSSSNIAVLNDARREVRDDKREVARAKPKEKVIERERIIEVPNSTVLYTTPYYAPPPVYYYPRHYYPSFGFHYGHHGHHHRHHRGHSHFGFGFGF